MAARLIRPATAATAATATAGITTATLGGQVWLATATAGITTATLGGQVWLGHPLYIYIYIYKYYYRTLCDCSTNPKGRKASAENAAESTSIPAVVVAALAVPEHFVLAVGVLFGHDAGVVAVPFPFLFFPQRRASVVA